MASSVPLLALCVLSRGPEYHPWQSRWRWLSWHIPECWLAGRQAKQIQMTCEDWWAWVRQCLMGYNSPSAEQGAKGANHAPGLLSISRLQPITPRDLCLYPVCCPPQLPLPIQQTLNFPLQQTLPPWLLLGFIQSDFLRPCRNEIPLKTFWG